MTIQGENRSLHLHIDGRVQGVGFRFFAEREAMALGLNGYVRNLADGRVETYTEGSQAALEEFLQRMKRGPRSGLVTAVEETWGEASGRHTSFRITF